MKIISIDHSSFIPANYFFAVLNTLSGLIEFTVYNGHERDENWDW